jgi:hypothetical protein
LVVWCAASIVLTLNSVAVFLTHAGYFCVWLVLFNEA